MKGEVEVLCQNYDEMDEEGKDELLTIGERYLNEIVSMDKKLTMGTDQKITDERLV